MNKLQERARQLRNTQTPTEQILWFSIRQNQIAGAKFRRQFTIEPYIVDFYCREVNLVIEVDGDVHADQKQIEHDRRRTNYLESKGLRVFRVNNNDIRDNLNGVLAKIYELVKDPHLASPDRGGTYDV